MLHIDTLQKSFAFNPILDIQSLDFPSGVHFIIGPNGAGKTTFLKCLAGIHPWKGKALLDGSIDLHRDRVAHRRAINFSEAEPVFPEYLRGRELLELVLQAKSGTAVQAKTFIDAVGIDYLDQGVGTYSSGMKKKLALMLAFLGTPKLILLDEPFAAVDQRSRLAITRLIRAEADQGVSFFISSHLRDLHAAFGEGKVHLLEDKTFREVSDAEVESWLVQEVEPANPANS